MAEVLLAVVLVLTLVAAVALAALVLVLRSVRRKVRVTRHDAIGAPVTWLAVPGPAAQLHRRLRRSVQLLRTAVPEPSKRQARRGELHPLQQLAGELEQHASVLARDLLIVGRMRGAQREHYLVPLRTQTAELERLCSRLAFAAAGSSVSSTPSDSNSLARITEHLDALEAAHAELAGLEAAVGLPRPRHPHPPALDR